MGVRTRFRSLAVATALLAGMAACGDRTVTSLPTGTSTTAPTETATADTPGAVSRAADAAGDAGVAANTANTANTANAADDADLNAIEEFLRDIDIDLTATEQDVATPEGDPTK